MDKKIHTHTKKDEAEKKEALLEGGSGLETTEPPAEAAQESRTTQSIERESAKLEQNLEAFQSLVAELTPLQDAFIAERISNTTEGKSILARLQEKTHTLIHSYEHSKEHLSHHYDPRLVKAVGSVGKAIGGFAGFVGGHGLMSAPGSVVGSKAGGYLTLKAFQEIVSYLPAELHDKIRTPKGLEEKKATIAENGVKLNEKAQEKAQLMSELGHLCDEVAALPEANKKVLAELIASDETQIAVSANKVQQTYSKYHDAFKRFEKKHPIVATGTEVAIHAAIAPILGGLELGEAAVHAIELLASTGGAEKFTTHLFSVAHRIKESIHATIEKMAKYDVLAESKAA